MTIPAKIALVWLSLLALGVVAIVGWNFYSNFWETLKVFAFLGAAALTVFSLVTVISGYDGI